MNEKTKKIGSKIVVLLCAIIFLLSLNKIRVWLEKQKAVVDTLKGNTQKVEINGSSVVIDFDTIASQIYYSFYDSDGDKLFNEDEKGAIEAITKCPKEYINKLAAVYATKYGKILKEDLISKLRSSQWKKIEYLFN